MSREQPDDTQAERAVLAHIRSLDAVQAPATLRRSIEGLASSAQTRRRRRGTTRLRLVGAGALAAAVAAVVAIALGGGAPPANRQVATTVLAASRLALLPATLAAPAESLDHAGRLKRSVEGVTYPYWGGRLGWQASGARTDRLGAHTITTVFYTSRDGRRIGYAIVGGPALPAPSGGAAVQQSGVHFRVLATGDLEVVTWREAGHTCVLAGRGVAAATLLRLAGWGRA
jgi:hypothetical protein